MEEEVEGEMEEGGGGSLGVCWGGGRGKVEEREG